MDGMPLIPQVKKLPLLLIPSSLRNTAVHADGYYLLVSIPLIAAVRDETQQERSAADVSFSCSSGAVRRRRRTENIEASARSDLDGDQGRGDYSLPASNDTSANWARGRSLPPLRAGNVRSAKDLQRPAFCVGSVRASCAYIVQIS